jgi:hypothetical protein
MVRILGRETSVPARRNVGLEIHLRDVHTVAFETWELKEEIKVDNTPTVVGKSNHAEFPVSGATTPLTRITTPIRPHFDNCNQWAIALTKYGQSHTRMKHIDDIRYHLTARKLSQPQSSIH